MKKRSNIKSQTGVIVTVLLIIIVIVAIIVVWNIVMLILKNSSSNVKVDMFGVKFEIKETKLYITGGAQVKVFRGTGKGDVSSFNFIFENKNGERKVVNRIGNISELETISFEFNSSEVGFNSSDLSKISVVPMFGTTAGIEVGENSNVYSKNSDGSRILYLPTSLGVVSWWKFDGNMKDSIGDNHGNCVNCPSLTTDNVGNLNSAYYFNGSSSINIPNSTSLKLVNYTICFWFKLNGAVSSQQNIFTKGNETNTYRTYSFHRLFQSNKNVLEFLFGIDLVNNRYIHYVIEDPDKWYHVAVSVNPVNLSMYINGDRIETKNNDFIPMQNDNSIFIAENLTGNPSFNGVLDNILITNQSLSDADIQSIYDSEK